MRFLVLVLSWMVLLTSSLFIQTGAETTHTYINGKIEDIAKTEHTANIRLNGKVYMVGKDCVITIQKKVKNSFVEEKGAVTDLSKNQHVSVKVVGQFAKEILIEKWRR